MSVIRKIMELLKSEDFCDEFGHDFQVEDNFDNKIKIRCRYCGREEIR